MIIKMKNIASFLLLFVLTFNTGSGLECYDCSSDDNKACDDPFDESLLQSTTCSGSQLVPRSVLDFADPRKPGWIGAVWTQLGITYKEVVRKGLPNWGREGGSPNFSNGQSDPARNGDVDDSQEGVRAMNFQLTANNTGGNVSPRASAVCAKAEASLQGSSVVVRLCTLADVAFCAILEAQLASVGASLDFCDTCDTDKCNLAPSLVPFAPLLLLTLPLVWRGL